MFDEFYPQINDTQSQKPMEITTLYFLRVTLIPDVSEARDQR
jgi:hypothetical protein